MIDQSRAFRRRTLSCFGASGGVLEALLDYTVNPCEIDRLEPLGHPLDDDLRIEAWEDYARDAERHGVYSALSQRLVQFRFPVEAGISRTQAYLAATRCGVRPPDEAPGLRLEDASGLELVIHHTLAGRVPVITCATRGDFVAVVQACAYRNEPESVPHSMGACIVNGLNNWDRVDRVRRRLEAERGRPFDKTEWAEVFRKVVPKKSWYQDRLIILSRDPYSAVPAELLGLDDAVWRKRSVAIRCEHECMHYFTFSVVGVMRNNLFDEFVADFAGLIRTTSGYDAELALRFFGLESHPSYRSGGRFENYLTASSIGPEAAGILRGLVVRAVRAVAEVTANMDLTTQATCDRIVLTLAGSNLVELASYAGPARLRARLRERMASLPH